MKTVCFRRRFPGADAPSNSMSPSGLKNPDHFARRLWVAVAFLLLATIPTTRADDRPAGRATLQRQQDLQRQARAQTQTLVAKILDVQLQNLEENKLDHLPIYHDIKAMRGNLSALVDGEMQQVVELLLAAEGGNARERQKSTTEARRLIREIVSKLATERQQLLRRLKRAELAAQLRRLIDAQTRVWNDTKALPAQPANRQEQSAKAAAEGQRDVHQLYNKLSEAIQDVSGWGGDAGTIATELLRELTAAKVDKELDQAEAALDQLQYPEAAEVQLRILRALLKLRDQIEPTGGADAARQEDLTVVRKLIEQQTAVRDATRRTDLGGSEADPLVESQNQVGRELDRLADRLTASPAARELLDQAQAAAQAATSRLFEAQREPALTEQGKVLGSLEQIASRLSQPDTSERSDKSARQLGDLARDLEQARAEMERIREQQAQATRETAANPVSAKQAEEAVAAALAKVDDNRQLPRSVTARLNDAHDAAVSATKALDQAAGRKADPVAEQAVARADRAVERAAAEIQAELDDAKRRGQAVQIGEIARAAETLERAAAAQREIADTARAAAHEKGLPAESARDLKKTQATIGQIADKVSAAIAEVAPAAAADIAQAKQAGAAAENELAQAEQQPGEPSRPAAAKAADQAAAAARGLGQAAANLRGKIAEAARQLADESGRQAEKVGAVRESVERALAKADPPAAERLMRLSAARQQVRTAQAEQQRAAGRPQAAAAMQLADRIEAADDGQSAAGSAAQRSQNSAPAAAEATRAQQAAAEQAAKLAETAREQAENAAKQGTPTAEASGKIAATLQAAAEASAKATQSQRDGRPAEATQARQAAGAALRQARELAQRQAAEQASAPAGAADPAAQAQVGKATAKAAKLAATDAPEASQTLKQAEQTSNEAAAQVQAGNAEGTQTAQSKTEEALRRAEEQIESAMRSLAGKQSQQLAKQSAQAAQLAGQAVPADPAAVAALRNAQDAAADAAGTPAGQSAEPTPSGESSSGSPARKAAAQSRALQQTQSAAASLAARQQRMQRDQAAAAAIARLAEKQQTAAGEIASGREALAVDAGGEAASANSGEANAGSGAPTSPSPAQRQSARRLNQAQQQFASAQRGAGQGAEAISGQSEVVNPPLREALDLASLLPAPQLTAEGAAASSGSQSTGATPTADGQPDSGDESGLDDAAGGSPATTDPALGTRFVPSSPEVTAAMIAGQQALLRAAALDPAGSRLRPGRGDIKGGKQSSPDRDGEPSNSDEGENRLGPNPTGEPQNSKGESASGKPLQGMRDQAASSEQKADAGQKSRAPPDEAWLLRLPPDLRQAIRARAQRPAPRSYEDRLQRYFESIE